MGNRRTWVNIIVGGLVTFGGLVSACNVWIIYNTHDVIYSALQQVSPNEYGLVLGTSPRQVNGDASVFFDKRIEAAARLYKHGKVKYLLLSGTHDRQYYNEPIAMQKALIKLGIPKKAILLDMEGTNTLTSIKRAKALLGLTKVTIITQRFHGYRAIYISRLCGINAFVFAAEAPTPSSITRTWIRELLARVKALIDLHILHKHLN